MLRQRVIVAVLGIPFLIYIAWLGGNWWTGFLFIIGLVSLYEYCQAAKNAGRRPMRLGAFLAFFALFLLPQGMANSHWVLSLALVVTMIEAVLFYPSFHIIDVVTSWGGALYLGLFSGFCAKLGRLDNYFYAAFLALLVTWANDTGAYFAGTYWGKNRLKPDLSPNKTWEGLFGGVGLACVVAAVFGLYFMSMSLPQSLLLGLVGAGLGTIGDLFASAVKRGMGVKDFGELLPGHGGVLDRFDSFFLVGTWVYFFFLMGG